MSNLVNSGNAEKMFIDITEEEFEEVTMCGGGNIPKNQYDLVLGNFTLRLTEEQEEKLRFYFQNT